MKIDPIPPAGSLPMLQEVLDRLAGNESLTDTRRRDLRSAVMSFAKLAGQSMTEIPLDLNMIRETLDGGQPATARVSAKRWANLRSDLAAAIDASGLNPMLKTAKVELGEHWAQLLKTVADQRARHGLSRYARWATMRGIVPQAANDVTLEAFISDLKTASLVRHVGEQHRNVAMIWNLLVRLRPDEHLRTVEVPPPRLIPTRIAWERFLASFREDVDRHLQWASVPDPLEERARARALAPRTRRLRRDHIHSAASAAVRAGISIAELTSLASLVTPETCRAVLRHCWKEDGQKLSAYTHGVAGTLIAIAVEWVKAPTDTVVTLKALRRKLGTLQAGLTPKNQAFLRKFDDPQLLQQLVDLPDRLWRRARRELATGRREFIDLQSALAIDLLIHVPLRMENLASLDFEKHLHWPRGRRNPALVTFNADETKNGIRLEYEIPAVLADRLVVYRNEIVPAVTGRRHDAVFVTWTGTLRTQGAITTAIERAVAKNLGVKLTPHQFRHLVAKIILDANPGAYELVRQMLGHRNLKTTTNFYAGVDTRRAGRFHAELLMKLREVRFSRQRRPRALPSRKH
jgi:integrase